MTVSAEELKKQLTWLKKHYKFVTLREVVDHVETGKALPEKGVLITFDDGYENNYTLAYPVFKQMGIPFSIFLVGNFLHKKVNYDGIQQQFLRLEQLHHMHGLVQYGYHGFNHENLMDLPQAQWEEEIKKGKEISNAFSLTFENAWAYT
ncbi:polysaccharide deacetylase family protein, partial [Bradyrhizobium sp. NBAIM08]|uniref:polysaccharide deacetylase family protein n=1 Tax=Bradyrhizobium sp. NBAIM08 TaxID=2793815 RepID=UPI001CD4B4C9